MGYYLGAAAKYKLRMVSRRVSPSWLAAGRGRPIDLRTRLGKEQTTVNQSIRCPSQFQRTVPSYVHAWERSFLALVTLCLTRMSPRGVWTMLS